ncbi:MAG: Glycosyl transferase family 2 [Candidatus Peregrinibacteria bacterium GW2011_GWA2_33_10]|nr:MAG: Glycosyl transferase family 2 [Candidatus Peregrinibacteria bacterium GW2011_GWA2_33_10]KKP41129.1 MAG: family 2 glycosyl transferase [Candidatus Peregrinibacteria bacterium GW2011_GWC2_33_13]OGJ48856.1 MAG: hypothetical protein A2229_05115 [Candidatus Peregrinibacteria bacterium RIFOXYA2_FULL_33_7]
MKTFIILPAFNEASVIASVIEKLRSNGFDNIIVIDDGSSDDTFNIAQDCGVLCVQHILNRGLGGALGTGMELALLKGANIIATFDADGQHDVEDLKNTIEVLKNENYDVIIGSRMLNSNGMPLIRKLFNFVGNFVTYFLFGLYVTDSQSGLRVFSRDAALKIGLKTNRMEVSSEIIREIKQNKLRFKEVPIRAIYTEYSLSKGQSFVVGIKTFIKLVFHRFMS